MAVYSHSRLQTFENCPKQYELAYIIKAPRAPSGIEAFVGSRVHDALEWLYREVLEARVPDEQELLTRFQELWDGAWSDDIRIVRRGRTAEEYRLTGEQALRDYYHRYHPFDDGRTAGLELRVELPLDDEHRLIGYIDRLVEVSEGVFEIHDYKMSSRLPAQAALDADRQLALYDMAVRRQRPDAASVELVWHYLSFDHEARSSRSPEQLESLRHAVLELIRHIESQVDFPPRVTPLCGWCDYRELCPAAR